MTTATVNTTCTITNNAGVPVVILNAVNASSNVATNSTKQGYEQQLTVLALNGGTGTVLADGATATITLDGTYVNSQGVTKPAYIYQLLVSKPDSLFPVMTIGQSLDFETMDYPPITVTAAAAANMVKALSFCQNIMTAPSSKMATGFQTAMTSAFSKGSISDSEAAVAAFFNQYSTFAGLDFPSYLAVSTWMKAFGYLWGMGAQGVAGTTYWVYSTPATGSTGATLEGTIVVAKRTDAPSPADPGDPNSGMTFTYTPEGSSATTTTALTFASGQLIDTPGGAIALNGGFGYRGTFSGTAGDTTVIPMLAGTLGSLKVMAIPIAPESGWSKFWTSITWGKIFDYFMKIMGLWMALDFLKQKLAGKDNKEADDTANENDGDPPSDQQQADAQNAGEEIGDAAAAENQQLADAAAGEGNVEVPLDQESFDSAVDEARSAGSDAYSEVASDNIGGGIDMAEAQITDLAQIEMTPSLEEAAGNLVDAKTSLESGELSDANSSLGDVTTSLPEIVEEMGDQVSEELAQQVQDSCAAQEEASDIAEETSDNADEAGSGDEDPFEDGDVPIE